MRYCRRILHDIYFTLSRIFSRPGFLIMIKLLALLMILLSGMANAQPADQRYCYSISDIPRDLQGRIIRSSKPIYAFRSVHPCPVTFKTTGACHGWAVDHVIPLASGGCDVVENMQWLPVEIKSCAGKFCKDRWERVINAPGFGE